ncbi:hypothetical protein AMECASPLE_033621, partial [Ameca splendens]
GVSEEEEEEAGPSSSALRLTSQAVSQASSKAAGSQSSSQAEGKHVAQHEDLPNRFLSFPKSIEQFIGVYLSFLEGACPSKKQIENSFSRVSRVRAFLNYMALGNSEVNSWLFLSDTLKIQNWTGQLLKAGKKITMVMFYLKNVYQFLQYFKDTPPQRSHMSKSQVIGSIRMVRSCMRHMQAKVTIHQMSVKSAKEKRAISQEVLAACRQQAREKIPQLLGENQ